MSIEKKDKKIALNYHMIKEALTLNDLHKYDYLNVTGSKDRPHWLYQGISEAKYADVKSSLKWNKKSTIEETLLSMDVSESIARRIWALTNWSSDNKYPILPQSILCKIILSQIMRGDYELDYMYKGNIPETIYGDSWATKQFIIDYMHNKLQFNIEYIEMAIEQLTVEQNNKLMFKKYMLSEILLKNNLQSIDKLGKIHLDIPTDIKYSNDQLEVFNSTNRVITISGGPGTGKSTIALGVIKQLIDISPRSNVVVVAPTHAAKQRLNKNTELKSILIQQNKKITDVETLHSLFYKSLNDKEYIFNDSILVIDEISMIGANLYSFINTVIEKTKAKFVVMMGDRNQCPPIKTVGSLPITMDKITTNNYNLTTCHRSVKDIYDTFNYILEKGSILNTFPHVIEVESPYLIRSIGNKKYEVASALNKILVDEFFSTFKDPFDTITIQYRNYDTMYFNWLIVNEMFSQKKLLIKSNPYFIEERKAELNKKWTEMRNEGKWDRYFYFVNMQVIGNDNDGDIKNNIRAVVKGITLDNWNNLILTLVDTEGKQITVDSRHVKPFYASTVHSMQGEEAKNIIYVWNDIDTINLAYTATSRAKDSLKIIVPVANAPYNGIYPLRESYKITSGL